MRFAGERFAFRLADIWPDRPPLSMSPIRLMKRPGRSIVEKLEVCSQHDGGQGCAKRVFFLRLMMLPG